MSKEQLYDLFQQILNIKKFEHQLLYNAMQVNIHSNLFHLGFAEAEFENVQWSFRFLGIILGWGFRIEFLH